MLTEEQKFTFDLKGYIVLPGALEPALVARLKARVETLENEPEALPAHERSLPGGPFADLIDHPAVIDQLEFAISNNPEKWRLESAFVSARKYGDQGIGPHGGGPTLNPNYHIPRLQQQDLQRHAAGGVRIERSGVRQGRNALHGWFAQVQFQGSAERL